MAALAQDLLSLVVTLLLSLVQSAHGAAFDDLGDGWSSWEVAAGSSGQRACCYHFRAGDVRTAACRLGSGDDGLSIDDDCAPLSDRLKVYVRVDDGEVREIRALSAGCPVAASTPVRSLDDMDTAASIAWLDRYARRDSGLAEEAVAAIAMHEDARALDALTAMIEDPVRGMDVREQALFWLAQSDDENAFRYIDSILSQR